MTLSYKYLSTGNRKRIKAVVPAIWKLGFV